MIDLLNAAGVITDILPAYIPRSSLSVNAYFLFRVATKHGALCYIGLVAHPILGVIRHFADDIVLWPLLFLKILCQISIKCRGWRSDSTAADHEKLDDRDAYHDDLHGYMYMLTALESSPHLCN